MGAGDVGGDEAADGAEYEANRPLKPEADPRLAARYRQPV